MGLAARRARLLFLVGVALTGAAAAAVAECRPEGRNEVAAAETCDIPGADYPIVRVRATLYGSVAAVAGLYRDPAACPRWQVECVGERVFPTGAANRTLIHRVSGRGFGRRVTVATAAWWRLPGGGAVLDLTGADGEKTELGGTRVLCLRERMTLMPAPGGRIELLHEAVRDPQPPFGLGSAVVTPRTVEIMLETLANLADILQRPEYRSPPPLDALPELPVPLPDLGAGCQAARRK